MRGQTPLARKMALGNLGPWIEGSVVLGEAAHGRESVSPPTRACAGRLLRPTDGQRGGDSGTTLRLHKGDEVWQQPRFVVELEAEGAAIFRYAPAAATMGSSEISGQGLATARREAKSTFA